MSNVSISNVRRLWILGASDPEMAAIETLLKQAGEQVAYAMVGSNRVYPGNAYKAATLPEYPAGPFDEVILVECGFTEPDQFFGLVFGETGGHGKVTVVDHHRPGDPGYGKPPEEYMEASSLGQVAKLLGCQPADECRRMIAAADHCLEAAYRGRCPGVDPEALMQWRVETRAAFQKRPIAEVLRDVENARSILLKAVLPIPGGTGGCSECNYSAGGCLECNYSGGQFPEFADLRDQQIPELPEAAAREGIPFISTVHDKDGRQKVVLQAASAELVQKFLAGTLVKGLTNYYGDPARGFAGGYTPS